MAETARQVWTVTSEIGGKGTYVTCDDQTEAIAVYDTVCRVVQQDLGWVFVSGAHAQDYRSVRFAKDGREFRVTLHADRLLEITGE